MATQQRFDSNLGYTSFGDGNGRPGASTDERSLGELFRELANDGSTLVRKELDLAKQELRETSSNIVRDIVKIAVAGGVILVGVLSLVAFTIVALGDALDNYWLSALIVAVVFLVAGGVLAMRATANMKAQHLAPRETMATLREDKEWARGEVKDLKRRVTS
jgi:uncharacterized membrane protein YqjE